MAVSTITAKPAAGPLTPSAEPLARPTMMPPTIPAIIPENKGAPEASAMPKHKGSATKNTTILAVKSLLKFLNINLLGWRFSITKFNISATAQTRLPLHRVLLR